jgi:hypothetical protein
LATIARDEADLMPARGRRSRVTDPGPARREDPMRRPTIAFVLAEGVDLGDVTLEQGVAALQKQVDNDFAPYWGRGARLVIAEADAIPSKSWVIVVVNDADQANALGYHDLTPEDLPIGKVFVRTSEQDGVSWTSVASHELLEMLGDPTINLLADMSGDVEYVYEVCDPVEGDSYQIDGVEVSNFVTPKWFEDNGNIGPWDFLGKTTKPLELTAGGYQYIKRGRKYTPVYGARPNHARADNPPTGSRRERRRRDREWQKSTGLSIAGETVIITDTAQSTTV